MHSPSLVAVSMLVGLLCGFVLPHISYPLLKTSHFQYTLNTSTEDLPCSSFPLNSSFGRPLCSFADANLHFACNGHPAHAGALMADGSWRPHQPCVNRRNQLACLVPNGQNQQYIVLLGDSNGYRSYLALLGIIEAGGASCHIEKKELIEDGSYFGLPHTQTNRPDCAGCINQLTVCKQNSSSVLIEYIRMEFVLDFEVMSTAKNHWDNNCVFNASQPPCKWAWNTQMFLFENYFPKQPRFPDHIHIFGNSHDCARRTTADFKRDLAWLVDLMDVTLRPTSNVYFWTSTAPEPTKQPAQWGAVTSKACLKSLHTILFETITPYALRTLRHRQSSRTHAAWFMAGDLFGVTLKRPELNVDGVHYVASYYTSVANLLMLWHCGSEG